LGKIVCNYLARNLKCTVLKVPHPSPMTTIRKDDYIRDVANRLNNVLNVHGSVATGDASSK
jgi:uracil DNA glycosylase